MAHFDTVIVGAGSAGCVLAARLSERADRRVLVLEAGPDLRSTALPDELRRSASPSELTGRADAEPLEPPLSHRTSV